MFFIGQNSNHVYVTYSFHELFIFFWLILVYRYFCFKFDSSLRQRNTVNRNQLFCMHLLRCETQQIYKETYLLLHLLRPKKVVLFPEIGRMKKILSLTRPHSQMCIRIYIFNFKNKQTSKKQTFYFLYLGDIHRQMYETSNCFVYYIFVAMCQIFQITQPG